MNSPVEVTEVKSHQDVAAFIEFPLALYAADPFFATQLKRDLKGHFSSDNPFMRQADVRFFIARKNGQTAGRIAAIINPQHVALHNERAGFFGLFECVHDSEVSRALLGRVADTLRKSQMEIMRGPMNFSTNDDCGFLIEGFENPPLLMTPYNPPYYRDLMEDAGMVKAKDLFAFIYVVCERLPEKIYRVASIAEKRGITVRRINKKRLFSEMMLFKDIYNSAWHRNWGFIPLNDEVLAYTVRSLKSLVREDLMVIAESKGMPVGFLGMIPDYNVVLRAMRGKLNIPGLIKALYYSHRITDLRLLLLGIREEYRNKGVDALMFREGFKGVRAGNYKRVEFSWILEDNIPVIRMAEMIEGQLYKKYRIYEKKINLNIA